jgi:hypothetical protein
VDILIESLRADRAAFLVFAPRVFYGLALLTFFLLLAGFAGRIVGRVIRKSRKFGPNEAFFWTDLTKSGRGLTAVSNDVKFTAGERCAQQV